MARLIEVEVRARDIDAAARFYREVIGVPLERNEPHPPRWEPHYGAEWGTWRDSGGDFALFVIYPATDSAPAGRGRFGFAVESVAEVHRRATEAEVAVVDAPRDEPWGRSAKYEDPDGNLVAVVEPPP